MLPTFQLKHHIRHEAQIRGALTAKDVAGKAQPGAQFGRFQRCLLGLAAKHSPVQPHHTAFARAHDRRCMTPEQVRQRLREVRLKLEPEFCLQICK